MPPVKPMRSPPEPPVSVTALFSVMAPLKVARLDPLVVAEPRVTVPEPWLFTVTARATLTLPEVASMRREVSEARVEASLMLTVPALPKALLF